MAKGAKNKNLIIFYIALFIILILVALFLSQYVYLNLEQIEIDAAFFIPHKIIMSIAKNMNHLTLFMSMCLLVIFGGAYILTSNNSSNFESDMDYVTDTILTPKAVGQSQHGSQRWLKEKEFEKTFASYTINTTKNKSLAQLLHLGHGDIKAVRNGHYEHIQAESNTEESE